MSSQDSGWMPETIGLQPTVLYWEADKIVIPIVLIIIGTVIGQFFLCLGLMFVYFYALNKYAERIPKGFGINILYMTGFLNIKSIPSFYSKRFEE